MNKNNNKFILACKDYDINIIKNIFTYTPNYNHLYLSIIYYHI